jgi:hypothetical protein
MLKKGMELAVIQGTLGDRPAWAGANIRKFVLGPFLLVLMDLLYPLMALIRC